MSLEFTEAELNRAYMTERQPKGDTAEQIRKAPHSAIYLCGTVEQVETVRKLAEQLGRSDLAVHPAKWLDDPGNYGAKRFTGIVLDAAAMLTSKQVYALVQARTKVIKQ